MRLSFGLFVLLVISLFSLMVYTDAEKTDLSHVVQASDAKHIESNIKTRRLRGMHEKANEERIVPPRSAFTSSANRLNGAPALVPKSKRLLPWLPKWAKVILILGGTGLFTAGTFSTLKDALGII
ncbi:hypothetical protein L914_06643 [Phytophthora nicotianae]|uniref:RxLR effector protein n=1 Tax=Phytophthora nicotianae TaxID=4792 RepID=W2NK18_PHYNI|nr:hypothetical protein L914_06643 [Phytophthora nicotianae]